MKFRTSYYGCFVIYVCLPCKFFPVQKKGNVINESINFSIGIFEVMATTCRSLPGPEFRRVRGQGQHRKLMQKSKIHLERKHRKKCANRKTPWDAFSCHLKLLHVHVWLRRNAKVLIKCISETLALRLDIIFQLLKLRLGFYCPSSRTVERLVRRDGKDGKVKR